MPLMAAARVPDERHLPAKAAATLSLALVAGLLAVACAAAQEGAAPATRLPSTVGLSVSAQIDMTLVGAEDRMEDSPAGSIFVNELGGGLTLRGAYGFTPNMALRVSLSGARHETSNSDVEVLLGSAALDIAYIFRNERYVRPYVFAGTGGFELESRQDELAFSTTGAGIIAGVGLLSFLSPSFALDFSVRGEAIGWEESRAERPGPDDSTIIVETPVDEDGSGLKFQLGVSWWFWRPAR
jgi:hypothetical protein